MLKMNQKNVQYLYADDGKSELILSRDEPRDYPWHFHARSWTFALVRSGSVVLSTLRGVFPLCRGQTFVIPPFAPHKLSLTPQSSLAVLCARDPSAVSSRAIRELIARSEECDADAALWLNKLGADFALTVRKPRVEEVSPAAAARDLLASRSDERFSVEELAKYVGYAPSHFLRAFKKEIGMTPHAFQIVCRVSRARLLLRSDAAIAEAAASSGFFDQSHLHKAFKLHHGLTPREFAAACVTRKR
jgi:AraC-like DNA-binding protein